MNAIRPVLARAYLELGELSRAEDLLATHLTWAQETGFPGRDVLRGQALLAARQGRWAEAHQAAEEGLHIARTLPIPYSEALLLEVGGQIHAHQGEPEQARERLQEALAIFRRLGARKDAERTEQSLERLA